MSQKSREPMVRPTALQADHVWSYQISCGLDWKSFALVIIRGEGAPDRLSDKYKWDVYRNRIPTYTSYTQCVYIFDMLWQLCVTTFGDRSYDLQQSLKQWRHITPHFIEIYSFAIFFFIPGLSRHLGSPVYAFCTNGWRRPQTEARFIEQLSTGKLGSWSRTLEHFPPFSLELVENIQRLSVPPNASGNQGYELFHGAHPTISKVCW